MKFTTLLTGVVAGMAFLLVGGVDAIDGVATYYTQQGVAGSCGVYHSDTDHIVALGPAWGHNNNCGRTVTIRHKGTGRVLTAVVADTCPSCPQTKLDVSTSVYEYLNGFLGLDLIPIDWHFN
ncbi:hypothetical protein ONS95_006944 [Cadophora gregata]|uniref:uncharacterized protein n=1 Tax=Cadophora gregata TaxID=51156 RepID=UPI0026DC3F43|nr:uncharacterized protein ONS95_006944 [Cadophora gregata]KAK0101794.1 hypothetical protein ONS95_006944 [Cadophora gregata]KAK0106191.1 hypothetical protein ONS96_003835 [Cadophora gregata f. sp. sojae]